MVCQPWVVKVLVEAPVTDLSTGLVGTSVEATPGGLPVQAAVHLFGIALPQCLQGEAAQVPAMAMLMAAAAGRGADYAALSSAISAACSVQPTGDAPYAAVGHFSAGTV